MGVTIHFEGKLKSESDYKSVLEKGIEFAKQIKSEILTLDADCKLLERVINEESVSYEGPVKGIQIQPHENSDPFLLEFDKDLFIQDYCKTQFAGINTHVEIINFLRNIEKNFKNLKVFDEGEYWETNDEELLEQHFDNFFVAFDNAKKDNPKLDGPYRIDGRIIDLME